MQKEIVLEATYLLNNIFSLLFFILSIVHAFSVIKIQVFNDTYFIRAFKVAAKDEGFRPVRFIQRVLYELKARTEKQKRKYNLMKYLLLKCLAYVFLSIYLLDISKFIIFGVLSLILFALTPNVFLKYINKIIKD